jgi:hypothetical protein
MAVAHERAMTNRIRLGQAVMPAMALCFSIIIGCGDDAAQTSSAGAGGAGGSGEGGAFVCPPGSHDDGAGACVATLGPFSETSPIQNARDHHVTWVSTRASGRYVFVAGGGLNMQSAVSSMERARINDDDSLGTWETLPSTLQAIGPIVASTDARVLIAGGVRTGGVSSATASAAILDDGTLGALEPAAAMNVPRFHAAAVLHDGWVYASGGLDASGTSSASVERMAFGDAGPSGAWQLETAVMPEQRSHHGLALHDGALYVTGGLTRIDNQFNQDIAYDTVLRSVIADDGAIGPWAVVGVLPMALAVHASFAHAGQLYVAHGLDMGTMQFTGVLWRAPIQPDGSIGAWEQLGATLPITRGHCHQLPLADGLLLSIAGTNELGSQTNAFWARFE